MLWKWLKTDVDMSKRRNKILTVVSIWIVATVSWIYFVPFITPCGSWVCTNPKNQSKDYVVIHENVSAGYTVIIMSSETGSLSAESKDNFVTAWIWKLKTLHNYSNIEMAGGK